MTLTATPIETVQLNEPPLLDALRALAQAHTLEEVRHHVAHVRRLLAPDSPIRSAETVPTACSVAHVAADLDQIAAAQTLDRARYYAERLLRGATEIRNGTLNDLNLNRWKEYDDLHTDSLWLIEARDGSGVHRADYWGNFVPQIPNQLMRRFTRPGDWVLDPFVGSGTTAIEAQRLGRNCLGIEIQPRVVETARERVFAESNPHNVRVPLLQGDSTQLDMRAALHEHGVEQVQLAILHPPYADIIRFSEDPADLSNAPSIAAFLQQFGRVLAQIAPLVAPNRHLALVISDTYHRGEWIPLGFQTMECVLAQRFKLKSIVVKNFDQTAGKRQQRELWRYRALAGGFYIFKHEYIFLFQKRK